MDGLLEATDKLLQVSRCQVSVERDTFLMLDLLDNVLERIDLVLVLWFQPQDDVSMHSQNGGRNPRRSVRCLSCE